MALLDLLHDFEAAVPHLLQEPGFLLDAHAVLAGDRAAERERLLRDDVEREVHALHLRFVALVGQERRVQVAVPHVAERPDLKIEAAGGLGDEPDHLRQLAARHGEVLQDRRRPAAGQRGKGVAAAQTRARAPRCRAHPHLRARWPRAIAAIRSLRRPRRRVPVRLHQQHRGESPRGQPRGSLIDGARVLFPGTLSLGGMCRLDDVVRRCRLGGILRAIVARHMVRRAAGRTRRSSTSVMITSCHPTDDRSYRVTGDAFTHWLPNRAIRPSAERPRAHHVVARHAVLVREVAGVLRTLPTMWMRIEKGSGGKTTHD